MYVFSARPFENHLCERLPCLKIINNNNNNYIGVWEGKNRRGGGGGGEKKQNIYPTFSILPDL